MFTRQKNPDENAGPHEQERRDHPEPKGPETSQDQYRPSSARAGPDSPPNCHANHAEQCGHAVAAGIDGVFDEDWPAGHKTCCQHGRSRTCDSHNRPKRDRNHRDPGQVRREPDDFRLEATDPRRDVDTKGMHDMIVGQRIVTQDRFQTTGGVAPDRERLVVSHRQVDETPSGPCADDGHQNEGDPVLEPDLVCLLVWQLT